MSADAPTDEAISLVVAAITESRRYRAVDPAVVRRMASEELPQARSTADAVKRVKRRLHQAVGAYRPTGVRGVTTDLERLHAAHERDRSSAELRAVCEGLMARHASTRERLPFLDRFYAGIWDVLGSAPASIVDLGCGLAPLALPWMALAPSARYHAIDADAAAIELVDGFLSLIGQPHVAEARDLVAPLRPPPADVALLLKLVPILDRQDPAAARRLLGSIAAGHVVVSFPVRSLGGHRRGMEWTYRRRVDSLLDDLGQRVLQVAEASVPNELVVVMALRRPRAAPNA
jgi:16S rRNA (guanine(1405)-N(7))-methyltransferase